MAAETVAEEGKGEGKGPAASLFQMPGALKQMPALSIPALDAKALALPTVALPSLDGSVFGHSLAGLWAPRAAEPADGDAGRVPGTEAQVGPGRGDDADDAAAGHAVCTPCAAAPPPRLPPADLAAEESEPPLSEEAPTSGPGDLHGTLMGMRNLLPDLNTPQLPSIERVAGSLPQAAWPWSGASAPADDPPADVGAMPRAPHAWYAGVLGTQRRSDYEPATTRTWQGGHSRAPEPNVSVRSSVSVQLPRAPGDKDYSDLDAASWNLVDALSANASHWQPADRVVDAAVEALRRARGAEEDQPPSSPRMPSVDCYFPPRNGPPRQGPFTGAMFSPRWSSELKPSSLGLTPTPRAHRPAPDQLENVLNEGSRPASPAGEEIKSPLRAPTVTFADLELGRASEPSKSSDRFGRSPTPVLARTLAHNSRPLIEQQKEPLTTPQAFTILHDTPASPETLEVIPDKQKSPPEESKTPDKSPDAGQASSARALPWYLQSAASRGSNDFSPGRPSVRETRDARLVSNWSPPQLSLASQSPSGKDQSPKNWLSSPEPPLTAPRGENEEQRAALETTENEQIKRKASEAERKQAEADEDKRQKEKAEVVSARAKAIEEHDRRKRESEQALLKAKEEQKKKRDAEIASARAHAQEDAQRQKALDDQARREADQAKLAAFAERRRKAEEAAAAAEAEAKRKKEIEEEEKRKTEEAKRKKEIEEEEERRKAAEAKRKKEIEEEEERKKAAEAKRKKEIEEEEERRKATEAKRRKEVEEEEERRKAAEAKRKKEVEEEEERRKNAEEKERQSAQKATHKPGAAVAAVKNSADMSKDAEDAKLAAKKAAAMAARKMVVDSDDEERVEGVGAGGREVTVARAAAARVIQAACRRHKAQRKRRMLVSLGTWSNLSDVRLASGVERGAHSDDDEVQPSPRKPRIALRQGEDTEPSKMLAELQDSRNFAGKFWQRRERERKEEEERRQQEEEQRLAAKRESAERGSEALKRLQQKLKEEEERERQEEEAANKIREEEEAVEAERKRKKEEEAAAKRKQEEEEAAAKRKREEEEAAAKRKREEEEAAARRKREEEEAAAKRKQEEEEEAASRRKREEEEAAAKRKQEEEEEAAARRKREEEAATAEMKRRDEERAEAERKKRAEEEAAAQQKRDEQAAAEAEKRRREEEEAAAKKKQQADEKAEAERKQQEEQKMMQERRRKEDEACMQLGDEQMGLAREKMRSNDIAGARAAAEKAAEMYRQISAPTETVKGKEQAAQELLKEIEVVEQKKRVHLQAANAALAATRKSLSSAAGASTAATAVQAVDEAKTSLKTAELEYARAGTLNERRQEVDVLALQVTAADKDAQKRQAHVTAGDTAVASVRAKLVDGDVEGCRAARVVAEVEYGQGREDRKDVLANLDDDIRNAAERKEMEERLERAKRKQAEDEEKQRKEEARKKAEEEEKKREQERRKQEEELRKRKEEEERRRKEEEERLKREEEERERREAEEARKAAAANVQCGDDHMAEARQRLETEDFDGAREARQKATDCYVKGGADRYDELKKLDAEIDAAIKKKEDADFFKLAKEKAFAQASEAQARWKEAEEAPKREAAVRVQAALRRALNQKKRKLAGALGHWASLGEASGQAGVVLPKLNLGLPPPSPSPNRPPSGADDEERARRARERRLQYLESAGGPSLLGDLQAAVHMESPRQGPPSARNVPMPYTTSAEVEADRARRAQERRNQFLSMHASPDALAQLQATLSASASGSSPRYGSSPRVGSGHMSPSYSASGASPRVILPSPRSGGGTPSPRTSPQAPNSILHGAPPGTSSPALPYSPISNSPRANYATAPGSTSPWASSPSTSRGGSWSSRQ